MSKRGWGVRPTGPMLRVRGVNIRLLLAGMLGLGWAGACSDDPSGPVVVSPPAPTVGLVVSDPSVALTSSVRASPAASVAVENEDVAYASLMPNTAPQGSIASVRAVASGSLVWTTVIDGGFDPVAVTAGPSDTIEVVVRDVLGAEVYVARAAVAAIRRPVVVRTEPPPKKRDVPLNSAIVIVFSEPVAVGSLTSSSVRLFRGIIPVFGTVSLLQGSGAAVAFRPSHRLAPDAGYRLVVSGAIRDLQGQTLGTTATVAFTTGTSVTGPAASLDLAPDTVYMTGATYQMTATVRDAAGNELIGQPVTWSTSDPSGLAVSSSGLLTAVAEGGYYVTAEVNGLVAYASVNVNFGTPEASLMVLPAPATVAVGDTIILTATVRDAAGRRLDRDVAWTSSDPAVAPAASLDRSSGTVVGATEGSVTITATSGSVSGTASVTITPPRRVASVTITPGSTTLQPQEAVQLSATLRDANGRVVFGRPITWTIDKPAVATVGPNGLVTGVGGGSATVTATSEGVSGTASVTVPPVASVTVTPASGALVVQGIKRLTATLRDANGAELVGRQIMWTSDDSAVATADGNGMVRGVGVGSAIVTATSEGVSGTAAITVTVISFSAVSAGRSHTCGLTTTGAAYCWGSDWPEDLNYGRPSSPAPVAGGLSFVVLATGGFHTCGLTPAGTAYCWGVGPLGDGSDSSSSVPVAVSGGLAFSSVSAGFRHTCGVTTNGAAYCWGYTLSGVFLVPAPVSGGLAFSSVSASDGYTCGLTTSGAAYCWGQNWAWQLGDGTNIDRPLPVAVSGGLVFSSISAGYNHTCGVTTNGSAYCWGDGTHGELGHVSGGLVPGAVTGGLTFSSVSVGLFHTCGVTTNGAAYCWGSNLEGSLGDGTTIQSRVPVAVAGGLAFASVNTHAGEHSCGLSTNSVAYCWGGNFTGQLGNPSVGNSSVPVKVAGQP